MLVQHIMIIEFFSLEKFNSFFKLKKTGLEKYYSEKDTP